MSYRQFGGGGQLDEGMRYAGLRKFAKKTDEFYEKEFTVDMPRLPRMNSELPFEDRIARVQSNLLKYLGDHDLFKPVMEEGKWKPGTSSVVVKSHAEGIVAA